MSSATTSTLFGSLLDSPCPSSTPSAFSELLSTPSKLRGDHLQVGSIALLCQNPKRKSIIKCKRNNHCGGKYLSFDGCSHAILILANQDGDDHDTMNQEETCLAAWVSVMARHIKTAQTLMTACRSPPMARGHWKAMSNITT